MGRNRKFVLEDELSEAVWKRILRGPRPASNRWPTAQKLNQRRNSSAAQKPRNQHSEGHVRQDPQSRPVSSARADVTPPEEQPKRTPEAMAEATADEVRRLESAVAALGEDSPHAKSLVSALKVAKAKLNVPISVQIQASEQYLERAKKRLVQAEEDLSKASAKKSECAKDVETTELRLARLRSAVPAPMQEEPPAVAELQSRIDELIRERDTLRASVADPVPTLPANDAEEVNRLRSNVEELQRERAMLRAEVARQRADPSALMSTWIDHGESLAREGSSGNRFNPLGQ